MCKSLTLILAVLAAPRFAGADGCDVRLTEVRALSSDKLRVAGELASRIFPFDHGLARVGLRASLWPKPVLRTLSRVGLGPELERLEFYVLHSRDNKAIGMFGLYATRGRPELWLGWHGLSQGHRGQGHGRDLLDFAIRRGRELGYETLRLWSSTAEEYTAAQRLYDGYGFNREDLPLLDPNDRSVRLSIFSFGLKRQRPEPFQGDLREGLLGANARDVAKGLLAYLEEMGAPSVDIIDRPNLDGESLGLRARGPRVLIPKFPNPFPTTPARN